jgi:hypothetical protein
MLTDVCDVWSCALLALASIVKADSDPAAAAFDVLSKLKE